MPHTFVSAPKRTMLLFFSPSQPLLPTFTFTPGRVSSTFTPRRLSIMEVAASSKLDAFTQYSGYLFQMTASEGESLTEYNISKIRAIYLKKPFILLRRLFQITTTLGKWFALRYYDTLTERADLMFEVRILSANSFRI